MSPWEIILIVLLSVIIVLLVLGVIVYDRFKELMRKQRVGFVLQDEFAGEAPIVFLGDSLTDFYPTANFIRRTTSPTAASRATPPRTCRQGSTRSLRCVQVTCFCRSASTI